MQKLYDRIGTEQHKYRLALQFTSIFIGNHGYVPPGTCYRIILQRGSKKYSSNYLNIKPNCQQPINETIQVKATMFFEAARKQYQEKKFDIVIMRKDMLAETAVAKFALMTETCLKFRGEPATYCDTLNKLQANVFCERVDGNGINCNTSVSDRSSIDRSIETRRRRDNSYQRGSIPSIGHMLMPQMQPQYSPGLNARHNDYQHQPNEQIRRSIVEQVRFDYGGPSMNHEQLRGSQNRANQHMGQFTGAPSPVIHYNHPQQGGYHNNSQPQQDYATRLPPPSPPKAPVNPMQSQQYALNDPTLNREAQKMFQMMNYPSSPNNHLNQNNGASQLSYNTNQQSQLQHMPQNYTPSASPFAQMSAKVFELSQPNHNHPMQTAPVGKYTSQPVLEALRENFKIEVTNPQQTQKELNVKKAEQRLAAAFNSKQMELPVEIGLVTNVTMLPTSSLSSSQPKLSELSKKSTSPTFKDLMNVSNERIPIHKKIFKKQSSKVNEKKQDTELKLEAKPDLSAPQIIIGPDITAVDSQLVDGPPSKVQILQLNYMSTSKNQSQPANPAKESFMSATFKINNFQDRLNSSFESPKFIPNEVQDFHKREKILKEQLEREREKYRQDLNLRRQLQIEKDGAYDNEIRFLNKQLQTSTERYRSEIAMREEFISQKEQVIERLNSDIELARGTNSQLVAEVERLTVINVEIQNSTHIKQLKIEEIMQQQVNLRTDYGNLKTDYELLSSQHDLLKSQYDQLRMQHNKIQANHDQASAEYRRLVDSHADLGEFKQNLALINYDIKNKLDQTLIELATLAQAKDAYSKDNIILISQVTTLTNQMEQLSYNNRLLQTQINSLRCQLADTSKLTKQVEWVTMANRNSIGEMEQLRAEKEILAKKQNDIAQKYIKSFNDLNEERLTKEQLQNTVSELENKLRDYPIEIRKRNEEIVSLHKQIKSMEFTLVNPQEDPTYLNMRNQIENLTQQIAILNQKHTQQINSKNKQFEYLNDKLNKTQSILNETVSIWTIKEKSLTETMEAKDRRMVELEKQFDKYSSKSQITVKYAHSDQDKRQLVLKIESLQSEIERLQELDDQIVVVEAINKDLQARIKQLSNENSECRAENRSLFKKIQNADKSRSNEELQHQLIKANTKISDIIQYVFRKNPSLANELARMKV